MFKNNLGIIFKRGLCMILTIMLVFNNSTTYVIGKNIDQSGFSNYIDDIKTGNIRGHELFFVTPNELYDQDQDGIMDANYIELLLADIDWYCDI